MLKNKQYAPLFLGALAMLLFITMSYLNKSIFLEQILICSFIIGLTTVVNLLGRTKKMQRETKRTTKDH